MPILQKTPGRRHRVALAAVLVVGANSVHAIGPYDSRNGDECRAQVNANFDAMEAKMRAEGNDRGIAVVEDRMRAPALLQCKALDKILQEERLVPSLGRLTSALDDLRHGRASATTAMQAIDADHSAILSMPPSPYRQEYLRQYADYQRYVLLLSSGAAQQATSIYRCDNTPGGTSYSDHPCTAGQHPQIPSLAVEHPAQESCEVLRQHVADSRRAYDQAVNALIASRQQTGDDWRSIETQRKSAMSDLNWYTDRARMQGCHTP